MTPSLQSSSRSCARTGLYSDRGFTLVEVIVAILVLLIGVLGALSLTDAAGRTTSVTRARESATNVARAVLESARSLPYESLVATDIVAATQAQPGLADADSTQAGWQIKRRSTYYTVQLTACAVDDPADGIGVDDPATYCSVASPTSPPDLRPADYKRVSATVTWTAPNRKTYSTNESTIVAGAYHGESVLSLYEPSGVFTDQGNPGFMNFPVTATVGSDHVTWSLDGNAQGTVAGCGSTCTINWNLGPPTGSAPCSPTGAGTLDGTYIVSANAYGADGLTDNSRASTVRINRCPPLPPTGVEGGETMLFPGVELQWDQSPEEDVIGYYVWTSTTGTGGWTRPAPALNPDPTIADCSGLLKTPVCVDDDTNVKVYYAIQAVDTAPDGSIRAGDRSPALLVDPKNSRPPKPGGFGVDNAFPSSIKWSGTNVSDPPPADYTSFFYVYRDAADGRVDRYDSIDNTGGTISWTDPDPGGVPHNYWVTSVDNHLAESPLVPDYAHKPTPTAVRCDAAGTCTVGNLP
jgi:prepilin-type N-terminal cleavage/methylation domain-containing protein